MSHWKNVLLRLPPPPTLLPPAVGREEEDDCTGGSKRNSIATSFHLSPSSIHLPLFLPPDGSRFRRPALAHLDSSATPRKPRGNQPSSSWLLGGALSFVSLLQQQQQQLVLFLLRLQRDNQRPADWLASVRSRCSVKRGLEIEIGRHKDCCFVCHGELLGGQPRLRQQGLLHCKAR